MFKHRIILLILSFVFSFILWLFVSAEARADSHHSSFILMIDLSGSVAHIRDPFFASRAGQYIYKMVAHQPLGTYVYMRSFGENNIIKNRVYLTERVLKTPGRRARDIAETIGRFVSKIPRNVNQGYLIVQDETDIVSGLYNITRITQGKGGTIVLLSDMLQYTEDGSFSAYEYIKRNWAFPDPPGRFLKGYKIIAIGAGYGIKSRSQAQILESLWRDWFRKAGATSFKFLSDV